MRAHRSQRGMEVAGAGRDWEGQASLEGGQDRRVAPAKVPRDHPRHLGAQGRLLT